MNFALSVLNSGPINGPARAISLLLTQPAILTQYSKAAFISAPTGNLTGIIVPYENRGVRPGYENRTIRIPRGL